MEMQDFISELETITNMLSLVIGQMKATIYKQQRQQEEAPQNALQQDVVGIFTEKEIFSMPKQFRKEFRTNGCTAHVRKKRNGPNSWSYEIRYRKNGYNVCAVATNLEDCKRKFIEKLKTAAPEEEKECVPTNFNQFAEYFFENYRKEKVVKETYYNTLTIFRNWIKPHFADKDIRKVVPADCKTLLDKIKAEGKGKTADEVYSLMNQTFKMAIAYNLIQRNPLAVIPHTMHEKVSGTPLTKEEEESLLTACKSRYRVIFAIYLYSGIRPGEIYSAKIDGKFLICENTKQKDHKLRWKKIPISAKLLPFVEQEIAPPKLDYIRDEFRRILPNHSLKDCRKTFSSRCQECGVNRDVVKMWMGHVLGDVLGKHYTAFTDEYMLQEITKINY